MSCSDASLAEIATLLSYLVLTFLQPVVFHEGNAKACVAQITLIEEITAAWQRT